MFEKAVRSRWFAAVAGATVAAVVAGGSAVLADHRSDGVIHGCVKAPTGALRIVDDPSECDRKNETAIEWNRQGEDGAPGLPGNLALAGQQCPARQVVSGFDGDGNLICTVTGPGDGSGGGSGDADADGDGFTVAAGDCNDANASVHPGAQEVADDLDNDCDGSTDEGISTDTDCDDGNLYTEDTYHAETSTCSHELVALDVDGDGYAATSTSGSSPDCDDSDAAINPGEPETVGDAIDNNCDGFVDDSPALNETGLPEEADFCRLQSPWAMTVSANATSPMVFGLLYEVGVTDSSGADPAVRAELDYGPQGSDPRSTPGWHYTGAAFRGDVNNADEYEASFVTPSSAGTYSYVYRFSLNHGATYTYCDVDGAGSSPGSNFQVAELGSMTVVG